MLADPDIVDAVCAQEYPAAFAGQEIRDTHAVRDLAFGEIWNIVEFGKAVMKIYRPPKAIKVKGENRVLSLDHVRMWLMYAVEHPSRGRKGATKPTMNATERTALVQAWVPIIRGLSTAHEKAAVDRCEFDMDVHLMPLLKCRVADIREFYAELVTTLKADTTIPFFVWAMFESWGDVILKNASDDAVRELKKGLAGEIADMVAEQVQPDLPKAIAGALQWRGPETLEKIKGAVASGGKPRLVGRESCLFLLVPDSEGREHTVML